MEEVEIPRVITGKEGPNRWNYEYFREYLRAISRGPNFLESALNYPQWIQLSPDWHQMFDNHAVESEDGLERWSLIGFRKNQGDIPIILQMKPKRGMPDHIPSRVIDKEIQDAIGEGVIDDVVGDTHSHPEKLAWEIWKIRIPKPHTAWLSPGDFFRISTAARIKYLPVQCVIQGNNQLVVLKTSHTKEVRSPYPSQKEFEKYWYGRGLSPEGLNLAIAAKYRLVLYRGNPGEDLRKIFPPRWLAEAWFSR